MAVMPDAYVLRPLRTIYQGEKVESFVISMPDEQQQASALQHEALAAQQYTLKRRQMFKKRLLGSVMDAYKVCFLI